MTDRDQKQLGNTHWGIADQLRGAMNTDDFRDYILVEIEEAIGEARTKHNAFMKELGLPPLP